MTTAHDNSHWPYHFPFATLNNCNKLRQLARSPLHVRPRSMPRQLAPSPFHAYVPVPCLQQPLPVFWTVSEMEAQAGAGWF